MGRTGELTPSGFTTQWAVCELFLRIVLGLWLGLHTPQTMPKGEQLNQIVKLMVLV